MAAPPTTVRRAARAARLIECDPMVDLDTFGYLARVPAAEALVYDRLEASVHRLDQMLKGMSLADASADRAQVRLAALLRSFADSLTAAQRAVGGKREQVIGTLIDAYKNGTWHAGARLLAVGLVGWIDPFTGGLRAARDEEAAQRIPNALKAICDYEDREDRDVAWHRRKRFVRAYGDALLHALRPPIVGSLSRVVTALRAAIADSPARENAPAKVLISRAHVNRSNGYRALRILEERGEWKGRQRAPRRPKDCA